MNKSITFIRHAESTFNLYGDKNRNVPLTDNGKNQASKLHGDYDMVICSTLRRTRQTLDYSNIKYNDVIFTDLCREYKDNEPANYYSGENIDIESDQDFDDRMKKFMKFLQIIFKKYNNICVITHGIVLYKLTRASFNNAYHWTFSNLDFIKENIQK
jgi:broad specificity phosphatase PhoE